MDVEAVAVSSPLEWARNHIDQYLESDGRDVDYGLADSLVLLYVTGRKSGQIRRVPILALREGADLFVMGSKGGAPTHPEWYLNLAADPEVWVRDHERFYEATAVTLDPVERADRVGSFIEMIPAFAEYEAKSERVIPMVRLSPRK